MIKLTRCEGEEADEIPVYVNENHIQAITSAGVYTLVRMEDDVRLYVKESPERVVRLIDYERH